jgi:hypothetical protein
MNRLLGTPQALKLINDPAEIISPIEAKTK